MNNIIFISCFYGKNFNKILPSPDKKNSYFFTNNNNLKDEIISKGWNYIYDDKELSNEEIISSLQSKYIKFLKFLEDFTEFKNYEKIIYLDHKINLSFSTIENIKLLINNNLDKSLIIRQAPNNKTNIYQEIKEAMCQYRYKKNMNKTEEFIKNVTSTNEYDSNVQICNTGLLIFINIEKIKELLNNVYIKCIEHQQPECQIYWSIFSQKYKHLIKEIGWGQLRDMYWKTPDNPRIYYSNSSEKIYPDIIFYSADDYFKHRKENNYPKNWSMIKILNYDFSKNIIYVPKNFFICKEDLKIYNTIKGFKLAESEPFISEDYFMSKADIMLYQDQKKISYDILNKEFQKNSYIIIGIHSDSFHYYLDFLLNLNKNFVLIITGSMGCFPYGTMPCSDNKLKLKYDNLLLKDNLLKLYTKSPSIIHDKIIGLPLGARWRDKSGGFLFSEDKLNTHNVLKKLANNPEKNFKNFELKKNLVYFGSMNIATTITPKPRYKKHINCREIIKKQLENKFPFQKSLPFEKYLIEMSQYKFVICPPGANIDTYRCWETLMVGSIPILYHTPLDSLFEKLPVLLIDDYSIITDEYLNEQYEIIIKKEYDFSILYTDYWDKEFDKYKK